MNRNVLMMSGLLVGSYVGLLWLVPHGPRAPASVESAANTMPVIPSYQESVVTEPSAAEDERLADEHPQPVAPIEVQRIETSEPVQPVAPSAPLPTIEAAAHDLRSDNDRSIRLAAVNSLLLLGRGSTVDPAITQALRDASADSDKAVATQASSALVEVERPMH